MKSLYWSISGFCLPFNPSIYKLLLYFSIKIVIIYFHFLLPCLASVACLGYSVKSLCPNAPSSRLKQPLTSASNSNTQNLLFFSVLLWAYTFNIQTIIKGDLCVGTYFPVHILSFHFHLVAYKSQSLLKTTWSCFFYSARQLVSGFYLPVLQFRKFPQAES